MKVKRIAVIVLGILLFSGCGQKAETKAPQQNAPVPTSPIEDKTDIVVPPPPPPPPAQME